MPQLSGKDGREARAPSSPFETSHRIYEVLSVNMCLPASPAFDGEKRGHETPEKNGQVKGLLLIAFHLLTLILLAS